jgi:membrane protein
MRIKIFFSQLWNTSRKTLSEFIDDNAVKLSASLSYYTIFSISPLLIIVISLSGIFFGREAVQGEIYGEIQGLVGPSVALQIQDLIKHVQFSKDTFFATTVSIITLIIGSTGVFTEIQDSINYIWGLKAKPKRGWLKWIINRLLSFSLIVTMSFLLLVTLVISALLDVFSARLQNYFEQFTVEVFYVINLMLVFVVITLLFTVIFNVLPDGKLSIRDSLKGAAFTAILFMIGKFAIGAYLGNTKVTSLYGGTGSVILILLWVYYSSIILYFGAEFTKVYARLYGKSIVPNDYAVAIIKKEIEKEVPKGEPLPKKML